MHVCLKRYVKGRTHSCFTCPGPAAFFLSSVTLRLSSSETFSGVERLLRWGVEFLEALILDSEHFVLATLLHRDIHLL